MASVVISAEARDAYGRLPLPIKNRMERAFGRLEAWPNVSGAKPLRGALSGQYRIRTGDYRIQISVEGRGESGIVTVVKIGHRDGFYDE